jgi:hypothetical protein
MINLARQAFANPFVSASGTSFQPGVVNSVGRCPYCGNAVAIASTIEPQGAGLNPLNVGANLGQQMGGPVPNPYAVSQTAGFGQTNPLWSQFTTGVPQAINPFVAQLASNWPGSGHPSYQQTGRVGAYGADPRIAFGTGQQFGYHDPNLAQGFNNPTIDPISSLFSQQVHPLAQQQQLPIRPLMGGQQGLGSQLGGQQGLGSQSFIPGFASPNTQWTDLYRAFIEAQLISQIASNPFYQLQRAYGGIPEVTGLGMPFGAGQQLNPFFANVPFYG